MSSNYFIASSVEFGICRNKLCKAVHIRLLDDDGVAHAGAAFECENIEGFVTDLRAVRDEIMAGAKAAKQ